MCVVATNSSSFVTHGSLRRSAAGSQATGAQPRRRSHSHAVAVCVVAGTKPPGSASATSSWSRQLRSSPALPSPTMLGTAAPLGETCSAHVHEPCSLQANIRVATRAVWRALCVALLHGCVQHVSGYSGVCYRSHAVQRDLRDMAAVAACMHACFAAQSAACSPRNRDSTATDWPCAAILPTGSIHRGSQEHGQLHYAQDGVWFRRS